jgi:hypothetical protein
MAGRIRSIEKFSDLFGNRTRDIPTCSIMPQPTTLPRAPITRGEDTKMETAEMKFLRSVAG